MQLLNRDPMQFLREFADQFKHNIFVRYGVLFIFVLLVFLITRSFFSTLSVITGIVLGRLSHNPTNDKMDL